MEQSTLDIRGRKFPMIKTTVAVIGSGAAALNAAVRCRRRGIEDVIIVTEKLGGGASANAGSDKQTYYRLNPGSPDGDSTARMAEDLYRGGCMHGDTALVEASLSFPCFSHLVDLGVPFPHDRFSVYGGFRTDNDPSSRGTSAGPVTSIMMYRALLDEARGLGIQVIDMTRVISLCTVETGAGRAVTGFLGINTGRAAEAGFGLTAFSCGYIVYATGGPASMYRDSVYPADQGVSLGPALMAGAAACNLTESQFGIASTRVRWNLSGSFQQVLPRYYSCGPDNSDEQEFLSDFFPSAESMLTAQFLKGYEWPFDIRKTGGQGSSLVDLLVYHETQIRRRRVFMDFRQNPSFAGYRFSVETLPTLPREYLSRSGAVSGTPVERLMEMNPAAFALYRERGIDLSREPLEISLCNQHLNGGLSVSIWWQSGIANLFPVGECAGTHGIYRPGGSALNAGQAGGARCAEYISWREGKNIPESASMSVNAVRDALDLTLEQFAVLVERDAFPGTAQQKARIRERMSETMGIIRSREFVNSAIEENREMNAVHEAGGAGGPEGILDWLEIRDMLVTEGAFLANCRGLLEKLDNGRGSFILGDADTIFMRDQDGTCRALKTGEPDLSMDGIIIETRRTGPGKFENRHVRARPVPMPDPWFESMWRGFVQGEIFDEDGERGEV